jgi:hypothetical protein
MSPDSKCICDDSSLFAEISSIIGVELCWNPSKKWRQTYLLQTVEDNVPVMWIGMNNWCRPFPAQVHCREFQGAIRTEWVDGKPSLFGMVRLGFRELLGMADPHLSYETLRSENGNRLIAVYDTFHARSFQDWRAEVIVNGNAFQMRMEHLPARKKILYNGDKITVSDENGEVVTALVDYTRPERGRITVFRDVEGVEAVLPFLFLQAREMETDNG